MSEAITLEGSPYEVGYQHGDRFSKEVSELLNLYKVFWMSEYKLSEDTLKEFGEKTFRLIEKWDKKISEELRGLSDGSGIDVSWITLLNARYDIVYMFRKVGNKLNGGCTVIGILPEKNKDGTTILSQNWDYITFVKEYTRLFHLKYEDGLEILYHGEIGIIGQKGMNNKGIGVVVNALHSDLDSFKPAIPFLLLMKKILMSENMKEAIEAIVNTPLNVSGNLAVASRGGEIFDFELVPGDYRILYPENGILVHTNHFRGEWCNKIRDLTPYEAASTYYRYFRSYRLLSSNHSIEIEDLKEIFRDHFSYPNSICAHVNPKDPIPIETLASVIMDLDDLKMEISFGNPCKNNYKEFGLG